MKIILRDSEIGVCKNRARIISLVERFCNSDVSCFEKICIERVPLEREQPGTHCTCTAVQGKSLCWRLTTVQTRMLDTLSPHPRDSNLHSASLQDQFPLLQNEDNIPLHPDCTPREKRKIFHKISVVKDSVFLVLIMTLNNKPMAKRCWWTWFLKHHKAALSPFISMMRSWRAGRGKAAVLTRMMTSTYRRLKIRMIYCVEWKQRWKNKHGPAHRGAHGI